MASGLKPVYKIVAKEMALGLNLRDICEARKLNYESIQRVARGELFKQEVTKLQVRIEDEMVQSAIEDPILAKLKGLSYRAVGVLGNEMENYDSESGAGATSRISASKAILEKAGYTGKSGDTDNKVIILSLSETKLNAVKQANINEIILKDIPDSVDGHLIASGE